jgi:hypothetical protein
MYETWLRPNRRAIVLGCVPPLIVACIGVWLACAPPISAADFWRATGLFLIAASVAMIGILLNQLSKPRIGFGAGMVLFYLRGGRPIAVPVAIVESFFFGQGPAHLPAMPKQPKTVNLIARLSQRHTEGASQKVRPSLGKWDEGYVTIRGTWCEPLNGELIRRLNRRLREVTEEYATK